MKKLFSINYPHFTENKLLESSSSLPSTAHTETIHAFHQWDFITNKINLNITYYHLTCLSSAFDTVKYQLILSALYGLGITGVESLASPSRYQGAKGYLNLRHSQMRLFSEQLLYYTILYLCSLMAITAVLMTFTLSRDWKKDCKIKLNHRLGSDTLKPTSSARTLGWLSVTTWASQTTFHQMNGPLGLFWITSRKSTLF